MMKQDQHCFHICSGTSSLKGASVPVPDRLVQRRKRSPILVVLPPQLNICPILKQEGEYLRMTPSCCMECCNVCSKSRIILLPLIRRQSAYIQVGAFLNKE